MATEFKSVWEGVETRGTARLWRRPGGTDVVFVVTDVTSNTLPDLGPEPGYPDADSAWAAYENRRGIAREIDVNGL